MFRLPLLFLPFMALYAGAQSEECKECGAFNFNFTANWTRVADANYDEREVHMVLSFPEATQGHIEDLHTQCRQPDAPVTHSWNNVRIPNWTNFKAAFRTKGLKLANVWSDSPLFECTQDSSNAVCTYLPGKDGCNTPPVSEDGQAMTFNFYADVLSYDRNFGPNFEPPPGEDPPCVLEELLQKCPLKNANYNVGPQFGCAQVFGDCLDGCKSNSNADLWCVSGCKSSFESCMKQVDGTGWFKFDCHDFAYEFCKYMRSNGFPETWIFDFGGNCEWKPTSSAHTVNIVQDGTLPNGTPKYCIIEPQQLIQDPELCWDGEPDPPPFVVNRLKKRYPDQSFSDPRRVDCNYQFYMDRGEKPWWECGAAVHCGDPSKIPRVCPLAR